jgi:hypothetical protein
MCNPEINSRKYVSTPAKGQTVGDTVKGFDGNVSRTADANGFLMTGNDIICIRQVNLGSSEVCEWYIDTYTNIPPNLPAGMFIVGCNDGSVFNFGFYRYDYGNVAANTPISFRL